MADKYADLRAALDAYEDDPASSYARDCFYGNLDSDVIRALLAERDRFFFALQEISHPEAVRGDATKIARAALAQEQGGSNA